MSCRSPSLLVASVAILLALPAVGRAQDLLVDGTTISLGGVRRYDTVRVINGGVINVPVFDGTDRVNTGNLVIIASSIFVDTTSRIDARGAGYQTVLCGNGNGPTPTSGGRGGCAVSDSGGGGAHFGNGGRGTKDCFIFGSATMCEFPQEFEEDCGNSLGAGVCTSVTDCRNYDALPTVAGQSYFHSIYDVEFGASGGDKGCRDGDGFGAQPRVGGPGGGRIVLVALTAGATGSVQIDGRVTVNGRRGCGTGNDSGGGGAGGSLLIVGDQVQVGTAARITAAGGLGGDTFSAAVGQPDYQDCPVGAQTGGTCDDCGGGGGGGIISVLSRTSTFGYGAVFDVGGAVGGVCPICQGEAGGGAGELQLDGAYVGELCDGYDNDFDGSVDESLGQFDCGLGDCSARVDVCPTGAGVPASCAPTVTPGDATCVAPRDAARPRIAVILDTSGSMLLDLRGYPTFGDGSLEHPGLDVDGDGIANDSRLDLARNSLGEVISAYPEIDFALARYHQDEGLARFCQSAAWLDCAGIPATYDDPRDNTGAVVCNARIGPAPGATIAVRAVSTGDECINYAGSCGAPRRGADILVGFGSEERDLVRWLDGRETGFDPSTTLGNYCGHASGGDCEVRGTGPTPLMGSLQAVEDYVVPIRTTDAQAACRGYSIVLVTDGAESCNGAPATAAARLYGTDGIETYVVAVSVLPGEEASLNAIAVAGSGGTRPTATFVRSPEDLVPALTSIIEGSLRTERCNGLDDDCDGLIDEDFPALGTACNDGRIGVCRGTGAYVCTADELATRCSITMPGVAPGTEICNVMDDDCDEAIDEGLSCTGTMCVPTGPEVCNGIDDDCNGLIDEFDPAIGSACGETMGLCEAGVIRCVLGTLTCIGGVGPRPEVCNGLDDDCDGVGDNLAMCPAMSLCIEAACRRECDPTLEFPCPPGFACRMPAGEPLFYCLPTACATCAPNEICRDDACVDPCLGVSCTAPTTCVGGECLDCGRTGCLTGQVCYAGACETDPCSGVTCSTGQACVAGDCQPACGTGDCPTGERCAPDGRCESDPCAGVDCATGFYCDGGTCRMDPCRGLSCPAGDVCASTLGCVDDPCPRVRCPTGRTCVVSDRGDPECFDGTPPPPPVPDDVRVLAAGGGAVCTASPGAHPSAAMALLLGLALSLFVRRRVR